MTGTLTVLALLVLGDIELKLDRPIDTWVTGTGAAKSVAWPNGPGGMTPKWIVAPVSAQWSCRGGEAKTLKLKAANGPNATPITVDLAAREKNRGNSRETQWLYLWSVDSVKAACTNDALITVDSVKVEVEVDCPKGKQKKSLTLPLEVSCEPATPSDEKYNGLNGSISLRGFGGTGRLANREMFNGPKELAAGTPRKLETSPIMLRTLAPPFKALRAVRVDAAGKVAERFDTCPPATGDDTQCRLAMEVTPKEAGTLRFAVEGEYFDGTSALSQIDAFVVKPVGFKPPPDMPYTEREAGFNSFGKFVATLTDPDPKAIDKALKDFVAKNPTFEAAGYDGHNFWARFRDGRPLTVQHTVPRKPPPMPKSPPAWVEHMKAGHEASDAQDYKAAQAAFAKAVTEAEKLGPEDPHVAASLVQLARVTRHEGRNFAATVPLYERALAIQQKVLGNHVRVVMTLQDLALMTAQTDREKAEALYRKALAICEALEPPNVLIQNRVMRDLSQGLQRSGRVREARQLARRGDLINAQQREKGVDDVTDVWVPDVFGALEQAGVSPQNRDVFH